ncbi:Response regulator receiver [Hyella patelloides LEGE 07179]|uniref:Response regulator receiver n=1 Tax=Hyella patelloides LEGE 07179 TaxID=945734 RepID=A0A563VUD2_9CYAN|nr:response regulator [Hyella patelloides]VEP15018.1 Response regulator receiver [Hyella patelloides LEGE 07179]
MPKPIIICVDDETLVLDSLKIELRKFFNNNCLYEFASSGEEGLEIVTDLEKEEPNSKKVVISDWWMPSMKGDEFLIAVHEKYPEITTIMLTGQASEAAIADVLEKANLHCCIRKPWEYEDLMHTIKQII